VFLILVIGGITRLTGSGLSITHWSPVTGLIPPLSQTEWQAEFELYREFPEYQLLNRGMSLGEFQFIYFWEYLHRLVARTLGLVFLIPFCFFFLTKRFTPRELRRSLLLLFLGALQGAMGWFMVKSGLTDIPEVSAYRLTAHLMLAFFIFALCIWFALDLLYPSLSSAPPRDGTYGLAFWLISCFLFLLCMQVIYGGLVAGHKAGFMLNTFPTMHGRWIPPGAMGMEPRVANLFANPVTVQWIHRFFGTVLLMVALSFPIFLRRSVLLRKMLVVLAIFTVLQYGLGVLTLLWGVPMLLGVLHQAFALLLFGGTLVALHTSRKV